MHSRKARPLKQPAKVALFIQNICFFAFVLFIRTLCIVLRAPAATIPRPRAEICEPSEILFRALAIFAVSARNNYFERPRPGA